MTFAYGQFCLFLHNPDPVHMTAPKRTLVSARDTHDQGLSYCDPGADHCNILTGLVDSNFAARLLTPNTRRSVTGYIMSLNNTPIIWHSCKQGLWEASHFAP